MVKWCTCTESPCNGSVPLVGQELQMVLHPTHQTIRHNTPPGGFLSDTTKPSVEACKQVDVRSDQSQMEKNGNEQTGENA